MSGQRYEVRITRRAEKDIHQLTPKLKDKLFDILREVVEPDPFLGKKLIGDLEGSYSLRLTHRDRIVYHVDVAKKIVYLERARSHYGD